MQPLDPSHREQQQIDQICDEFESTWKSSEAPNLDEFAARIPESLRLAALKELVILDAFYRSNQPTDANDNAPSTTAKPSTDTDASSPAKQPTWNEYVARFPELASIPIPEEMLDDASRKNELVGGRFRNLRAHASGGLGRVSVAEDIQFKRPVAIKEMHAALTSVESYKRRFHREAEITGQLEHPGIVPVYALGTHENGAPFYAMRLIQGHTLLDAIERIHAESSTASLSRERRQLLSRFVDVCQSIEYSHRQGVIHRDVKPANIMLGEFGETLIVDWGLAKKTDEADTGFHDAGADREQPEETQAGTVLGTPAYMSPEQADGNQSEIGPHSDIYSLGATLLHLVTGDPPVPGSNSIATTSKASSDSHADASLRPLLAICHKAMSKSPEQRYDSASSLARDVERVLFDEPVQVFRDPLTTRIRRWIDRHRTLASMSAVAACFTILGLAAVLWIANDYNQQLLEKNNQLDRMFAEEARLRTVAEQSEARSTKTVNFLVSALRSPDPNLDGREVKIVDILDQSVDELGEEHFAQDPLMLAQISYALGRTYRGLGKIDSAESLVENAFEIYRSESGPSHPTTLSVADSLANIYRLRKAPETLEFISKQLDLSREELGQDAPLSLQLEHTLAMSKKDFGDFQEAMRLLESVIERTQWTPKQLAASTLMNDLAVTYVAAGKYERAAEVSKQVYELRREQLESRTARTITAGYNYIECLAKTVEPDLIIDEYERLLQDSRKYLGNEHYQTLRLITSLGTSYLNVQQTDKGLELIEESLRTSQRLYGENHPRTIVAANSLGLVYMNQADYPKCIEQFKKVYDYSLQTHGEANDETLTIANNLASSYRLNKDFEAATKLFQTTLAAQKEHLGKAHPNTIRSMLNLAATMQEGSQGAESIPLCQETYQVISESKGVDHPYAQTALSLEAMAHLEQMDFESAKTVLEKCHASRAKTMPSHWLRFYTMGLLGEAHLGLRNLDEAESLLRTSYEEMLQQKTKIPLRARVRLEHVQEQLVKLYEVKNQPDEADRFRVREDEI